jgi:hypothetical protein
LHGAELRDLPQELAALHGLERILVLELREHQLQEVFLAEISVGRCLRHVEA